MVILELITCICRIPSLGTMKNNLSNICKANYRFFCSYKLDFFSRTSSHFLREAQQDRFIQP